MASNLTQTDMDTLWTAASTSDGVTAEGPFNEVGTDTGVFVAANISSDFEKNLACLIAMTEAIVAAGENPSTSTDTLELCKQQRRFLRDTLARLAANVKPVSSTSSDTRATATSTALGKAIRYFNYARRPDAIES